jgi:hypothetical protein
MNGVISNYHLPQNKIIKSPIKSDMLPVKDRVEAALAELMKAKDNGSPLSVVTTLKKYSDMVITNLVINRDAANGNSLDCTLTLRKVKIAKTLTADIPVTKVAAKGAAKSKGTVATEPTPTPATEPAVADSSLLSGATGFGA